jgi:tetratricopeptide (TPR) repeat protein
LGGVGLVLVGLGVPAGLAYRRRANADSDDEAGSADDGDADDVDDNGGADNVDDDGDADDVDDDRGADEPADDGGLDAYERAEEALATADAARRSGDYETALDHYRTAGEQYEAARERHSPGDDRRVEIDESLAATRDSIAATRDHLELVSELVETLTLAEETLQTAVTTHADGQKTVPRLRYRQARDRYEEALETVTDADRDPFAGEPLVITRETESVTAPPNAEVLPDFGDGRTLAEAGIGSRDEFEAADKETLEELSDLHQTAATAWWTDEVTTTFANRTDVEDRREAARTGFDEV